MMQKPKPPVIVAAVAVIAAVAVAIWWFGREPSSDELTLYGNVDVRQISLAFSGSERVAEMRVGEGDRVRRGQVLAVQDTATLRLRIARAQAQAAAQEQALRRLKSGSRPEEVEQARAGVASAQARADDARQQFERLQGASDVTHGRAVSRQEIDSARASQAVAQSGLVSARKALELAIAGPRSEDIDQAEAQLRAAEADLALMRHQLEEAELKAPVDATVRGRLLEPGDMASPQRPAYSLAITDPKWVRAYVSEIDLGRVKPGQSARIATDSDPGQWLAGQVGYISSVAEFTPKTVQTEDLRTSLVYEIRINVQDPGNRLRLGMPATVHLALGAAGNADTVDSAAAGAKAGTGNAQAARAASQ